MPKNHQTLHQGKKIIYWRQKSETGWAFNQPHIYFMIYWILKGMGISAGAA